MVHRAKVDWWVGALFGGGFLLQIAVGAALIGAGLQPFALISAAAGALLGMLLWTSLRTSYEVTASDLIIRFGPFRTTLAVGSIVEVAPTRDPTSAPAPSLDRLRIDYRRADGMTSFTLISPKDKEAFLRDLARVAPQVQATA
jgi:hypothetical protein